MNIEDLLERLYQSTHLIPIKEWDKQFIISLNTQLFKNQGLTEKQRAASLRLLKKYSLLLNSVLKIDIRPYLEFPTFRFSIRNLVFKRSMTIIDEDSIKLFKVEFPYIEEIIKEIKLKSLELNRAVWSNTINAWTFDITENNILFLKDIALNYNFEVSTEIQDLFDQSDKILSNIEVHTPMLIMDQGIPTFKNTFKTVPPLNTNNILESIFEARKVGILVWDETINQYLNTANVEKFTKLFLNTDLESTFYIDCNAQPIECLTDIIRYLNPCLVIVPGGNELAKVELMYNFLKSKGIKNNEISIMFRLPNENHKNFNEFVKNNKLNSPISKDTKIVFISYKFPKPLIKLGIKFNSILHLGSTEVHYSVKEFVHNHQNLIYFTEKSMHKEDTLVYL